MTKANHHAINAQILFLQQIQVSEVTCPGCLTVIPDPGVGTGDLPSIVRAPGLMRLTRRLFAVKSRGVPCFDGERDRAAGTSMNIPHQYI